MQKHLDCVRERSNRLSISEGQRRREEREREREVIIIINYAEAPL